MTDNPNPHLQKKILLPGFHLSLEDLRGVDGLARVHDCFLSFLQSVDPDLRDSYDAACASGHRGSPQLIMALAPILGQFLERLFGHGKESQFNEAQRDQERLTKRHRAKVQFIRRRVAVKDPGGLTIPDTASITRDMAAALGTPHWDEDTFAGAVLDWMDHEKENAHHLNVAVKYGWFALYTADGQNRHKDGTLFHLPKPRTPGAIPPAIHGEEDGAYTASPRDSCTDEMFSFNLEPGGLSRDHGRLEAHYCLHCHLVKKDTCRTGRGTSLSKDHSAHHPTHGQEQGGCPLDQKISEMMALMASGDTLGALAVVMLDNPLVPLTGHRICADCKASCVFQTQDPVEIPGAETSLLYDVLDRPWGFEIYRLLTLWNPLDTLCPLPAPPSGRTVLVVGSGPAGIGLAHYLLRSGHQVIQLDGLTIDPLPSALKEETFIHRLLDYWRPLNTKVNDGFGGVSSYGITHRWDKNFLTMVRLLLERHPRYALFGGVTFGPMVDQATAAHWGIDFIAFAMGAGGPKIHPKTREKMPPGVRYATDFLMTLHQGGGFTDQAITRPEITLPLVVVGGGLTAIDGAVYGLRYYGRMVMDLHRRWGLMEGTTKWTALMDTLTEGEKNRFLTYLTHGRALSHTVDPTALLQSWGGVRILYRGRFMGAPAFRLNGDEVIDALRQGIFFQEEQSVDDFITDGAGRIAGLRCGDYTVPAASVLLAVGTDAHDLKALGVDDALPHGFFGDMDPPYRGSVVKALASAKNGHGSITRTLTQNPPKASNPTEVRRRIAQDVTATVVSVNPLADHILELVIHAPLGARRFQPGQFFRLETFENRDSAQGKEQQNKGAALPPAIRGLALTGAWADPEGGFIAFVVVATGPRGEQCRALKAGDVVSLMGPAGVGSPIPQNRDVILVGGGFGCAVLPALGQAMMAAGCRVTIVAAFRDVSHLFYLDRLRAACNEMHICVEKEGPTPPFPVVFGTIWSVLDTLPMAVTPWMMAVGPAGMMDAIRTWKNRRNNHHRPDAHCSLNAPMQCMMGGECGQCLQRLTDGQMIFACKTQDHPMDQVDFDFLKGRLAQNDLFGKIAAAAAVAAEDLTHGNH